MIEAQMWHPVALAEALPTGGDAAPLAVDLLEQPLVLWRDSAGQPQAFTDRCPHRGARLSLGRVCAGQLACPYHGWRFEPGGQLAQIPALPGFVPPAGHRATAHPVLERHGLLWVLLQPPADGPLPALPAFAAEADERLRKLNCGPYEVAASAPRIVENFLDMAHFGFVHEGWLGDRGHTQIPDYRIDATPTGFIASGCTAWQPQSSVHAQGGAMVEYTYEVNAPYTAVLTKVPQPAPETPAASPPQGGAGRLGSGPASARPHTVQIEGFREAIALFICPITPERSRVWFRLAMNDFESPDATLQAFQHTIFTQDQPVLESQRPQRLPISDSAPVQELHCAADRSASAYRRHLRALGIRFGTC